MNEKGQFRIIEALISAVVLITALVISMKLQQLPYYLLVNERTEYEAMAFNALMILTEEVDIEALISQNGWENKAYLIFKSILSPTLYFNLSIFEVQLMPNGTLILTRINDKPISNIGDVGRTRIREMMSITYVHTSRRGRIFLLTLAITPGRSED